MAQIKRWHELNTCKSRRGGASIQSSGGRVVKLRNLPISGDNISRKDANTTYVLREKAGSSDLALNDEPKSGLLVGGGKAYQGDDLPAVWEDDPPHWVWDTAQTPTGGSSGNIGQWRKPDQPCRVCEGLLVVKHFSEGGSWINTWDSGRYSPE